MTTTKMTIVQRRAWQGQAQALALVALLLPYLISGVVKLFDLSSAEAEVRALTGLEAGGLSLALTLAVIVTQLGGSALLITGRAWAWAGGMALAVFTLIATFLAHTWWHLPDGPDRDHAFNGFWEHIALVGALAWVALRAFEARSDA